ncbi:MAG TPA: condensation domain-containing protein, partial [Candidatus Dormibacteraeota bacterium]|nr:condensation domain-containing protein [Candidatus Dormibacteraeota bacterium]
MKTRPRIEAIHPLTPLQEGILFHSLAAPGAGLYLVQPVFELEGDLDPALLRRAAEVVVERHAALRSAFAWQGQERPRQVVHRRVEVPWEERDLRGREPAAALAAFLEEDRARGLDPGRAPLCRFALLRIEDRRRWLVVAHHHLVLDGWSMPIVTRELAAVYDALRAGRPADLPPARPFGDYAAWLARRPVAGDERFWRDALRGFRAPTPLVVDTVARAAEGGRPQTGRVRGAVEAVAGARLREFGRRRQLAFATLAQAAWALLLSRYSGERDVLFGVVTSGRSADLEGVEGIVGMFVNTLPVRVRVPRRAPLLPWLRELQAALAAIREHEHCALTQVQAWSELPAGTPLFESLLAVQTLGPISPELRLDGLAIRPVAGEERVGLPLTAVAYPAPGEGVWLGVEYDRRRVPPDLAAPLLDHYGRLLAGLAVAEDVDAVEMLDPTRPGGRLHVLDAELRPLPGGATGDVWLAGDPLPAGWRSAAFTAERLRPDPAGAGPGARMLRTGWRARLRPDGELEHL